MPLDPGARLGPYEILSPLGAGGMGEVYRARDARLGRDVALKVLPSDFAGDPSRRQRFEQEARAIAALNHPNIVAIYDVGENYFVSELVDGEPLRGAKFGVRKVVDIGAQIASGLAAAHDAGIVHRDLKPDNILLTREGRVKILDFGLAKVQPTRAAAAGETVTVRTEPGVVMGTVGYMSPEQVRGASTDHRTDIFCLGVILHELLTGNRVFHGDTSVETMTAILKQDAPELPESIPGGLRQIVSHCLEKEPGNRFQSARDLGFALSHSLSQSGIAPVIAKQRNWRWPAIAAASAAIAFAAGAFLLRTPASPQWIGSYLGGPDIAFYPRLSPDGRTVAFLAMVGTQTQVAVIKPESGNWLVLTHDQQHGSASDVSWSADGTRLYYDRVADVPLGVYSVPVLGGPEQQVLEDAIAPEALPDGSMMLLRLNVDRRRQLFRYWPDSGKLQAFPIEVPGTWGAQIRAFPDGREVALIGDRFADKSGQHVYAVNLANGQSRRISTGLASDAVLGGLAVAHDGSAVLLAAPAGDVYRVLSIPAHTDAPARSIMTITGFVGGLESGPDGSLYVEQDAQTYHILRMAMEGGAPRQVRSVKGFPSLDNTLNNMVLFGSMPDGRAIISELLAGRQRLVAAEEGKDSVPLISTTEETTGPVTLIGNSEMAFLIGPPSQRSIATATLANGRVTRRISFDHGNVMSLAASLDGATLYAAADGMIWSIPLSGGAPAKFHAGDAVALEPDGQSLLIQLIQPVATKLVRVALKGGAEQEIPLNGPAPISNYPISTGGIRDGRLAVVLAPRESWYFDPGIVDLKTGRLSRIPVDYFGDCRFVTWLPHGQILASMAEIRSSIWKFTPEKR